jgi:hypothetical protein
MHRAEILTHEALELRGHKILGNMSCILYTFLYSAGAQRGVMVTKRTDCRREQAGPLLGGGV